MPYKFDAEGNMVVQEVNGHKLPVFVHADGKEAPLDGDSTVATISRLNGEAKDNRIRAETAEGKLKPFEGITDPAAAVKALETVANLDSKKLIDAGEVEKVKTEISKAFQSQLDEANGKVQTYEQQLYAEKIGGSFSRSKLITDKFAIPADMVQARFGSAFKVEDGKTVAYDQSGNKIFSRARPGEIADFDEALEVLVDGYAYKEQILKGSGANGGGAGPSNNAGGKKSMSRTQFEALDPTARIAAIKDTTITD